MSQRRSCPPARSFTVALALAGAVCASPAVADEGRFSVGAVAGTLGAGPELGYRFGSHLGVRGTAAFFEYDRNEAVDDIDYDGTLDLKSYGLKLDVYPFGGGFRVSAGVRANDTRIDLVAAPTTNVTVGDVTFTPAQIGTLRGRVAPDDVMPTLTLGYGGRIARGFTLGFDVGVGFQGKPKVESLVATGGTLSATPQVQAELATEAAKIEDEIDDYDLWPIVQISFLWRS